MSTKPILIVDDEVNVLASLTRLLTEENLENIKTAQSGQEALEIIKNTPDLALIISDFHMAGMNGIELLSQVRESHPDITRVLLTGAADLGMALEAVNKGNIFRFLLKPCATDILLGAVKDGLRQNELINSEHELLSKTLNGSIKVMIDILAVVSPGIFSQASRLRTLARELSAELQFHDRAWEIELAALLSQIGAVTIPKTILEKWKHDEFLDDAETKIIRSIPRMGKILINNIPRMENIAEAVGYQNCTYHGQISPDVPTGENIPILARIIKIIIDYERLTEKAHSPIAAYHAMIIREAEYDPEILAVFRAKVINNDNHPSPKSVRGEKEIVVDDLKIGMVISRDIMDKNGIMIVAHGTVISNVLRYKLVNYFRYQAISQPVFIEGI
ncbi:MAG: HD domain-containing phosphohydrolase [Chloroflexota bacterium]